MSEKENLIPAEEEITAAEETVNETIEEVSAEEVNEEATEETTEEIEGQESLLPQEETSEIPADEVAEPAKSESKKMLGLFAGMFLMSVVVSVLISFLILHYMPAMKYNKAMKLIEKEKYEEAYELLDTIDEEYDKAKYELKKFVKIPSEETTVQGGGEPQVVSIKTKTKKNYYKLEVKVKDQMTGEDVVQTQEYYFDDMGNNVKEVATANGTITTTERKFDKYGNTLSEKKSVESTEENSPVDYSAYGSDYKIKDLKYYYIGK